jgi:galactokinase
VAGRRSGAFAPGRVNLIGEHTDYNQGIALPFAIAEGIAVHAETHDDRRIQAYARDLDERDDFSLEQPVPAERGWRAYLRGVIAELQRTGIPLAGATLEIGGDLPRGAGLSSSAALEVALCLALTELGCSLGEAAAADDRIARMSRLEIAQLCARVEHEWVGAQTGLLDQLACLHGAHDSALLIDFRTLAVKHVPLVLGDWRLVVLDSGERHAHASSGYNERRAECARACELLGVASLRDADAERAARLPPPLDRRVAHVIDENERVRETVAALREHDLQSVAPLLNASHASLRDLYEISTPAAEATVECLLRAGATGARMVGGGFGGSVLALFPPDTPPPAGTREVRPSAGARLLAVAA